MKRNQKKKIVKQIFIYKDFKLTDEIIPNEDLIIKEDRNFKNKVFC